MHPNMLSDCTSKDSSVAELFIVQDGSAGVTAKRMRDRINQAVFPIDSNIISVKDAEVIDVLDDEAIKSLIAALGVGICLNEGRDVGPTFTLAKIRYGKIIIVLDETREGNHIREQLESYFRRFAYPVIAGGYVYAIAPDRWAEMSEEEFELNVLSPSSRQLVQLEP